MDLQEKLFDIVNGAILVLIGMATVGWVVIIF